MKIMEHLYDKDLYWRIRFGITDRVRNTRPSSVVEWCVIRMWAHATTGKYGDTVVPELKCDEMMRRWGTPLGGDPKRIRQLYRQGWRPTVPEEDPYQVLPETVDYYPESTKLLAVSQYSHKIGEFLDWCNSEKEYTLCAFSDFDEEYLPVHRSNETLLAEFFEIDLDKVEQERRAMLDRLREAQESRSTEGE